MKAAIFILIFFLSGLCYSQSYTSNDIKEINLYYSYSIVGTPYYYLYIIKVIPDNYLRLMYNMSYDTNRGPKYVYETELKKKKLKKIFAAINESGVLTGTVIPKGEIPCGSESFSTDILMNDGIVISIPSYPDESYALIAEKINNAIIKAVQDSIWNELKEIRKNYIEEFSE